jgi:hypothetical protein
MIRQRFKTFTPAVILFIILNGFFIAGKSMLERWGMDREVLIIGNLVLFLVTLTSFLITQRGLNNSNTHAFIRSVYGGFMIKFFVCAIAAFVYISMNKEHLNRPALFTCMGLFLVYLFLEVAALMKLLKAKKNA